MLPHTHPCTLPRRLVEGEVNQMIADCGKMPRRRRGQSRDCGLRQNAKKEKGSVTWLRTAAKCQEGEGGRKARERRDDDLSKRWRAKLDAAWLKYCYQTNEQSKPGKLLPKWCSFYPDIKGLLLPPPMAFRFYIHFCGFRPLPVAEVLKLFLRVHSIRGTGFNTVGAEIEKIT
jgi:hypothetical protein